MPASTPITVDTLLCLDVSTPPPPVELGPFGLTLFKKTKRIEYLVSLFE